MKLTGLLLFIILLISVTSFMVTYVHFAEKSYDTEEFFFGVSFGQETVEEAKLLIDQVKDYSNFFLINNWNIATNKTALNQVSEYAVEANLNFMVYFAVIHEWHLSWFEEAEQKWGEKFLGAYLYDEPGGRQIDTGVWFSEAGAAANPEYAKQYIKALANSSSYSGASKLFTSSVSSYYMQYLKDRNIPVFTSDYALYWFDYLTGYDTVFVQLGWGHETAQHIALCRGAANTQSKDWGAIITWTYNEPPYIASGPEILEEMLAAYLAGAKYVLVFNYARDPETEKAYCILANEHFEAMQDFWNYIHDHPGHHGQTKGQIAYVLPKDYGWGMRHQEDNIWGFWSADEKSQHIWENVNKLIERHGLKLDIIYDDPRFDYEEKYSNIHFWDDQID